ncbi:MAG TPA: acyltransferase family protein [Rhizomicrobium sp.]|jgi:peptidoglycan/LPS O-acetylase OafA/YrhL|nr:acyltransferase family protein [Rhizomicrobium sp.]
MTRQRFHALDGLRGVCALSVLLFHASDLLPGGQPGPHFYLAVDMFFLLSGFVIAFAHESGAHPVLDSGP